MQAIKNIGKVKNKRTAHSNKLELLAIRFMSEI